RAARRRAPAAGRTRAPRRVRPRRGPRRPLRAPRMAPATGWAQAGSAGSRPAPSAPAVHGPCRRPGERDEHDDRPDQPPRGPREPEQRECEDGSDATGDRGEDEADPELRAEALAVVAVGVRRAHGGMLAGGPAGGIAQTG